MFQPELSIVIPTYNEAERLPPTLRAIESCFGDLSQAVEVVVVDDGSTDATREIALAMGARVLHLGGRVGAGAAVREGMLAAKGKRVLLTDADGSVPFADLTHLHQAIDAGYDVAAGSRVLEPGQVEVRQPWHRVLMGKVWAWVVTQVLPTPVRDTQCGFKLFTQSAAQRLFSQVRSRGFAFHAEVLSLAPLMGMRVKELPVRWRDRPGSKVRLIWDSGHMLAELIAAAQRHRRLRAKRWLQEAFEHD